MTITVVAREKHEKVVGPEKMSKSLRSPATTLVMDKEHKLDRAQRSSPSLSSTPTAANKEVVETPKSDRTKKISQSSPCTPLKTMKECEIPEPKSAQEPLTMVPRKEKEEKGKKRSQRISLDTEDNEFIFQQPPPEEPKVGCFPFESLDFDEYPTIYKQTAWGIPSRSTREERFGESTSQQAASSEPARAPVDGGQFAVGNTVWTTACADSVRRTTRKERFGYDEKLDIATAKSVESELSYSQCKLDVFFFCIF